MKQSLSVLQNLKQRHLRTYPYAYLVIEDALPEAYYRELEASLPGREQLIEWFGKDVSPLIGSYYNTREKLPAIWQDFFDYHISPEYVNEVMRAGEELNRDFPLFGAVPFAEIAALAQEKEKIGARNTGEHEIVTDCQIVSNAPGNTLLIGPHLDSPPEIYAGLLYMPFENDNAKGGELEVYACKDGYKTYGRNRFRRKYISLHETVPYKRNTFVMFFNSAKSAHGVSKRVGATLPRRHVNIIGECRKNLYDNKSLLSNSLFDNMLWKLEKRLGKVK